MFVCVIVISTEVGMHRVHPYEMEKSSISKNIVL